MYLRNIVVHFNFKSIENKRFRNVKKSLLTARDEKYSFAVKTNMTSDGMTRDEINKRQNRQGNPGRFCFLKALSCR